MEKDKHWTGVRRPGDCEAWLKTNFKLSEEDEAVTVLLNCSSLFHSVSPSLLLEHLIIFILCILMRLQTEAVGESDWRFNSSPSVGLHYLWVYDIIARDVSWMGRWKPSQWNTSTVSFVVRCCWIASEEEIIYFQNKSQQLLRNWCTICLKLL